MILDIPDDLKPFTMLGFIPTKAATKGNFSGTCAFCGKHDKMFIDAATGMWDCKAGCGSGNVFDFLNLYRDLYIDNPNAPWEELSMERGLPVSALERDGAFWDGRRWCFPFFNAKGRVNYYQFYSPPEEGQKSRLINLACGKLLHITLGNFQDLENEDFEQSPIFMCESRWDRIALEQMMVQDNIPCGCVHLTGAGAFTQGWTNLFQDRDIIYVFDNDKAGREGIIRCQKYLGEVVKSARQIRWDFSKEDVKDGFDCRDLFKMGADYNQFTSLIGDIVTSKLDASSIRKAQNEALPHIKDGGRPKLDEVREWFNKWLCMTDELDAVMRIGFSAKLCIDPNGDPFWCHIVGSPGCLASETVIDISLYGKRSSVTIAQLQRYNQHLLDNTKIYSRDASGVIRLTKIIRVWCAGKKPVFCLRTAYATIYATAEHPFLTPRGWLKLSELTCGDCVATVTGWENIIGVVECDVCETYDIQVVPFEGMEPNYIADHFVVHNSGKTETVMTLAGCSNVTVVSSVSSSALRAGNNVNGRDISLIPKLIGGLGIFKDYVEVLNMNPTERDEVYGILTGAFDGLVYKAFGNGIVRHYVGRFNLITGVTRKVMGEKTASLGERFLSFLLNENGIQNNGADLITAAIDNEGVELVMAEELRDMVRRFVDVRIDPGDIEQMPSEFKPRLVAIAQITARLRTPVPRDTFARDQLLYTPQAEVGTRVAKQLKKCFRGLAAQDDDLRYTPEAFNTIISRIGRNSANEFNTKIVAELYREPGQTQYELSLHTGIPHITLASKIADLGILHVIKSTKSKIRTNYGEVEKQEYALEEDIKAMWGMAFYGR